MSGLNETFTGKRVSARNTLGKILAEKNEVFVKEQETLRNELRENTFKNTKRISKGRLSILETEKRNDIYKRLVENFMIDVVREACPLDINHVATNELREQIAFVRQTYSTLLESSSNIMMPTVPVGINPADSDHVSAYVGTGEKTPEAVVKRTLTIAAAGLSKDIIRSDEDLSFDVENIDLRTTMGPSVDSYEFKEFYKKLVATHSAKIKGDVVTSLKQEIDKESEYDTEDTELTEAARNRMKRREQFKSTSLLSEVFKTVRVLNETVGATTSDYLNEAVFISTVMEAHKSLGLVTEQIGNYQATLVKMRRDF